VRADFTIKMYLHLLSVLEEAGYTFQTYSEYALKPRERVILLRHDVDARKENSLQFAKIQHEMCIEGTYYFRMVPESFDKKMIREIASMGHEIGYHYETMDKANGDVEKAYDLFCRELKQLREIVPVKTICMHGSPLSKYDNRDLWKHYDYRELGIIAEPYFDLEFSEVLYLTDTGRRWDGEGVSIRDKIPVGEGVRERRSEGENSSTSKPLSKEYSFRSTHDIINACKSCKLPYQIMMNFHPQRWTDSPVLWARELVVQRMKNVVKRAVITWRKYHATPE